MVRPRPPHTQGGVITARCNQGGTIWRTRVCRAGVLAAPRTHPVLLLRPMRDPHPPRNQDLIESSPCPRGLPSSLSRYPIPLPSPSGEGVVVPDSHRSVARVKACPLASWSTTDLWNHRIGAPTSRDTKVPRNGSRWDVGLLCARWGEHGGLGRWGRGLGAHGSWNSKLCDLSFPLSLLFCCLS